MFTTWNIIQLSKMKLVVYKTRAFDKFSKFSCLTKLLSRKVTVVRSCGT